MVAARKKESEFLKTALRSKKSTFILLYGRRRVGKTYLIRELFKDRKCLLIVAIAYPRGSTKTQLKLFVEYITQAFGVSAPSKHPKSWKDAFSFFHEQLVATSKKVVLFLDELPDFAGKRSDFLESLEYYWNTHWASMQQLMLICCGFSADSFVQKMIHERLPHFTGQTHTIHLKPFTYEEAVEYLHDHRVQMPKEDMKELYNAVGGIPRDLDLVNPKLTLEEIIRDLFFTKGLGLSHDITFLFDALFGNGHAYAKLIYVLSQSEGGLSARHLKKRANVRSEKLLLRRLKELCDADFLESFYDKSDPNTLYYRLIDNFCRFYMRYVYDYRFRSYRPNLWLYERQIARKTNNT